MPFPYLVLHTDLLLSCTAMLLTIQDLIADPKRISELRPHIEECQVCGKTLQETITGKHETAKGVLCSDHYYEMLGEGIEAHPIVSGGARRG
jgi:hypothetical protein